MECEHFDIHFGSLECFEVLGRGLCEDCMEAAFAADADGAPDQ